MVCWPLASEDESAAEADGWHALLIRSPCAQLGWYLYKKSAPPISPAWIVPGLVTGGARSRNHKKTRRWCDTLPAHLLDRIQMYAERNPAERFVRVAVSHFADKTLNLMVLNYYGQLQYPDVSYALQAIQKSIRLVFHTGGIYPEPLENLDEIQSAPLFLFGRTRSLRML